MFETVVRQSVDWVVLVCFAYLGLVFAMDVVFVIVAAFENAIRKRQREAEGLQLLRGSNFTIPVSLVAPVYNEEAVIRAVVRALLGTRYPDFEIVIVNDGSTDRTLDVLREELDLEPREMFVRRVLSRDEVRTIYVSRNDRRVVVIDKVNGGNKADALNVGIDFTRYPYVCCIDGDTIYSPDALVTAMAPVHRDPDRVVGVTSQVAVAAHPERRDGDAPEDGVPIDRNLLSSFQHLEYLRSFLNDRLAWSRLDFMLCASGAFMVWRRDVLEAVGGFSSGFSCEDIEMTFRVHEHLRRHGQDYKIVALPEIVATTEAPTRLASLVSQRARWQRVTLETVWHYRRMLWNPRYGAVGMLGAPFLLVSEVIAPVIELLGFASLAAAVWLGEFTWEEYLFLFLIVSLANATLTSAGVWLEDSFSRTYRLRDLVRLMALAPLEFPLYRPSLFWARLKGTWGFLRGHRGWDKFDRNLRDGEPPFGEEALLAIADRTPAG